MRDYVRHIMRKSSGLDGVCCDYKNKEESVTLKLEQTGLDQPMTNCREKNNRKSVSLENSKFKF